MGDFLVLYLNGWLGPPVPSAMLNVRAAGSLVTNTNDLCYF